MPGMSALLNDHEITERVLSHIANRSTDVGDVLWREPVENYRSKERFAADSGCANAFVCPYHGWTYELNGSLRHIPHAEGFPGLDKEQHGLAPLRAVERHGLVFVSQASTAVEDDLAGLPEMIANDQKLYATSSRETQAN